MKFTTTKSSLTSVNIFVYGNPGVGKTVLCSTAPKPIIISSEKGLMSIAHFDIPVVEISSLADFREAYAFVKSRKDFKTVCIDSISDIADTILADLKKTVKDPRMAYGRLQDEVGDLLRKFRDLDMNTYVVGKASPEKNDAGILSYLPSMPSKRMAADLPFMFDIVCPLRTISEGKKLERYLQTQPDNLWFAKDRSGVLDIAEQPDLSIIFDKVLNLIAREKSHGKGKKGKKAKEGKE